MLKQRILTALVLIPLVVASLLWLPTSLLVFLFGAIIGLAGWEWLTMIGVAGCQRYFALAGLLLVYLFGIWLNFSGSALLVGGVFWLLVAGFVIKYAHIVLPSKIMQLLRRPREGILMAGLVLVPFGWTALLLHGHSDLGGKQLLFVLVLVWLADTGGYFAGKRWGRQKLATAISPNKTWQGVQGGLVLGGVWALLAYSVGWSGSIGFIPWLLLSVLTLLWSVVGDLFESVFKRAHDIKDSGNLLPGHGGILDRIDSLTAAVPIFVVGVYLLGALGAHAGGF